MRAWNLNDGASRLQRAFKDLQEADLRIGEEWSDQNYVDFQETYLVPLEAALRRAVEAIQRMAEILEKAERECGSY